MGFVVLAKGAPSRRAPHTEKNHTPFLVILRPQAEESVLPSLAPSLRELSPKVTEGVSLLRTKTGGNGFFASLRMTKWGRSE